MKPLLRFGLGVYLIFCFGQFALAQDDNTGEELPQINTRIVPRIIAPEAIEVGKKVIFDGSFSEYPEGENIQFEWESGDGNTSQEFPEIVHTYQQTGAFTVRLTIRDGEEEFFAEKGIFVFDTRAVLITTNSILEENSQLVEQAKENGVFLKLITMEEESSAVLMEERFLQKMQQERSTIANANLIIFWDPSSLGIRAFTRYWQSLDEQRRFLLGDKSLIRITETEMSVSAATLQQLFEVLNPQSLLLTRPESLSPIFQKKQLDQIIPVLEQRQVEFKIIEKQRRSFSPLILSRMITGFMAQGIPASTIFLVLSFPFIAFFVAFFHQIVGLSTYGVFLPVALALSFQVLPIPFALLVITVILALSFGLRFVLNKIEMLYVPRAALKISIIVLSFLSLIWFALRIGLPISITLAVFPMLIMSSMSEKFVSAQNEEGLRGALFGAFETVGVALLSFFLVNFSFLRELLLSFPEIIILPLLGTVFLGRFTGLRLSEYIRFKSLLKEGVEE